MRGTGTSCMQGRVAKRIGRGRLGGSSASTSVAALLIGGGAPPAFANIVSSAPRAIRLRSAIPAPSIASAFEGHHRHRRCHQTPAPRSSTRTGPFTLSRNGIIIQYASVGGAVVNAGQITASGCMATAFLSPASATVSGGINNSGTISAGCQRHCSSRTTPIFAGGISNSGTISGPDYGIFVYSTSTFAGGIGSNSGTISAGANSGIWVVAVSSFAGGSAIQVRSLLDGPVPAFLSPASRPSRAWIGNSGTILSCCPLRDFYVSRRLGLRGVFALPIRVHPDLGGLHRHLRQCLVLRGRDQQLRHDLGQGRRGHLTLLASRPSPAASAIPAGFRRAEPALRSVAAPASPPVSVTVPVTTTPPRSRSRPSQATSAIPARSSPQTGIVVNNVATFLGAIANSGTITGTGGTAIDI